MLVLVTPAFASLEGSVPSISVSSGQEPAGAPVDRRRTFQDDEQPDQETVQVEIKAAQVQQDQPIAMATNTTPTTDSSGLRKKPLIQLGMVVPKEEGAPSDPGPQPRASATTVAGPAGPPARTETKPPAQASPAKSAPVQAAEEEEDESGSDESLDDEAVSYRTPDSVLKHLDRTAGGLIDPKVGTSPSIVLCRHVLQSEIGARGVLWLSLTFALVFLDAENEAQAQPQEGPRAQGSRARCKRFHLARPGGQRSAEFTPFS
eukprot:m.909113 g.909113  ORF g.909113 m.909113 type:complete len:261 (+) comp60108_c0_seq17:1106-1888(+)